MSVQDLGISVDTVWMLLAAMLVFFMQPGFALCEAGFTRSKNTANILFKNFVDFMIGSVLFWFVGFGFMFGSDGAGFIGMPNFGDLSFYTNAAGLPTEGFLMFETVFCATSATIVSGAMAERTKFSMYCVYSFFISLIIYPVEGHWTWLGGKRPNQLSFNISYSKQSDVNSNYINQNYYNNLYNYAYGYGTSSNYYTDAYDPDKYVKMINLSLGFGKRLRWPDDYFTFMAELAYTRYMLKSWQYFLITDGNCNNINLSLSLQRNSTDHPFYPRKGSEFLLQTTLTPPYSLWDGRN